MVFARPQKMAVWTSRCGFSQLPDHLSDIKVAQAEGECEELASRLGLCTASYSSSHRHYGGSSHLILHCVFYQRTARSGHVIL